MRKWLPDGIDIHVEIHQAILAGMAATGFTATLVMYEQWNGESPSTIGLVAATSFLFAFAITLYELRNADFDDHQRILWETVKLVGVVFMIFITGIATLSLAGISDPLEHPAGKILQYLWGFCSVAALPVVAGYIPRFFIERWRGPRDSEEILEEVVEEEEADEVHASRE